MRNLILISLVTAFVLAGCSEDKTIEERLAAAANIFAGYSYNEGGVSFAIEDFDMKVNSQAKTMDLVNKRTGRSFSVSELEDCRFVFRWNTDPKSAGTTLAGNSSVLDFSKLNMKSAKFFNSQIQGYGILKVSGIDGAITHTTVFGTSTEAGIGLPGIPVTEKEVYLSRIKTMEEKYCKGRS